MNRFWLGGFECWEGVGWEWVVEGGWGEDSCLMIIGYELRDILRCYFVDVII